MNRTPTSLLKAGHICARLGGPLASAVQHEKVARILLAKASPVFVVQQGEGSNERRSGEYSHGERIPRAVLCGRERRAIFAFYSTLDWEWFARVARRLYLPAVVRNPRTMFSMSRSTFETARRRVTADHLDLVIALGLKQASWEKQERRQKNFRFFHPKFPYSLSKAPRFAAPSPWSSDFALEHTEATGFSSETATLRL